MWRGDWGDEMDRSQTNFAVTVAGVALLAVAGGAIWFGIGDVQEAPNPVLDTASELPESLTIRVHVSGAVVAPAVVELAVGAIVADAVAAVGGATRSADLASINLAATVRAGERVIVPELLPHGAAGGSDAAPGIDLNTATASDLEALPGVGPVLAERIVALRNDRGPFLTVEDLLDVPGIGEAKLALMRDAIARP